MYTHICFRVLSTIECFVFVYVCVFIVRGCSLSVPMTSTYNKTKQNNHDNTLTKQIHNYVHKEADITFFAIHSAVNACTIRRVKKGSQRKKDTLGTPETPATILTRDSRNEEKKTLQNSWALIRPTNQAKTLEKTTINQPVISGQQLPNSITMEAIYHYD